MPSSAVGRELHYVVLNELVEWPTGRRTPKGADRPQEWQYVAAFASPPKLDP